MRRHSLPSPTLSREFSNKLIITVSCIFLVTSLFSLYLYFLEAKRINTIKHQEYLEYLSSNLALPLWNIDRDWIESICNTFSKNEIISLIKVISDDNELLFSMVKEQEPSLLVGTRTVSHNSIVVGTIELGFTQKLLQKSSLQIFVQSIPPMMFIIGGIVIASKLLIKRYVEKPLNHLIVKMDEISAGTYRQEDETFGHYEMTKILNTFNEMAAVVKHRESSLIEANHQLELEIADRMEAEKAHQDSEQRYRQLVTELPVGVFRSSTDVDGGYLMVNPAMIQMLGYDSEDELLKLAAKDIYSVPEMRRSFIDMLFREKTIQGLSLEMKRKNGDTLEALISARLGRNDLGDPAYLDGIIEDVTERNNLERQIRKTQKMEAIGTLAGGIAHDFNNILASIFGFTEAARMRHAEGKPIAGYFDEILEAGLRARGLIKQMLAFSRQSEVKRIATSIGPLIKETVKFLRASQPATIEIKRTFNIDEAVVWADPTQVHQVLMNLCTNAAYAMREKGGVIEVILDTVDITENSPPPLVELQPGPYIMIEVKDQGQGISPEHIDKIFDPFFTTKPRGKGTGMGLAVVHGIVTDLDGIITVNSTPDSGTTFSVYLPHHLGDIYSPPVRLTPERSEPNNSRILLVDDEEGFLQSGQEILESLGYEVMTANSGDDALHLFHDNPEGFDLVITDLAMARMTGLKLAEQLRKIRSDTPIILCTGFSTLVDRSAGELAGIKEIIMKPLLAHELVEAISRVTNSQA